mgnify:CR=1 FL=1
MLFYGPSGAGKKTRISCVLRELFGPGVEKVRHHSSRNEAPTNQRLIAQNRSTDIPHTLEEKNGDQPGTEQLPH